MNDDAEPPGRLASCALRPPTGILSVVLICRSRLDRGERTARPRYLPRPVTPAGVIAGPATWAVIEPGPAVPVA